MDNYIQFDTSETIIGGKNICEAVETDKRLIFNESYTVIGPYLKAPEIYACYDLTVEGSIIVDKLEVRGSLFVSGNIKAKILSCEKSIICKGNIESDELFADEIISNNVFANSINCSGNLISRATIDARESVNVDNNVFAVEGILGTGSYSARNSVAGEYVEIDGSITGKVLELDRISKGTEEIHLANATLDNLTEAINEKIIESLRNAGEIGEEELLECISKISSLDNQMISDWKKLSRSVVELSYVDHLDNLRDYLFVLFAKRVFPREITEYETVEHVFSKLLDEAESNVDRLQFHADDVYEIANSIRIVLLCENEIKIDKKEALDRIFQSIGIKYKTIESFLG